MTSNILRLSNRSIIFVPGVIASLLPALLLTNAFASKGYYLSTLFAFWPEILIGPLKYWFPILLGYPMDHALHAMSGSAVYVYLVCLLFTLTHPIKPNVPTACITAAGFFIWYSWALLLIASVEY